MASGCLKVTKYFLFLFNLLFFVKISQVWQHLDVLILTPRVLNNGDANWEILVWTCQAWEILLSVNVVSDTSKYLKLQRAVKILYAQKWKEALTPTMEEWIEKTMGLILGAVILGFGIWILVDKTSFISVLQTSSTTSKVGAYILTGVGALTMLMGFLGCVGAVNEIRCLLGLYFTCLLLILIAQIAAGLLIYFQRNALEAEMSGIVSELVQNYNPYDDNNRTLENAWDYVQLQLQCCGWTGPETWKNNTVLQEKNQTFYPCSCYNDSFTSRAEVGFCPLDIISNSTTVDDWPVKKQGCMKGVQNWLQDNLGIILGVCTGVAVIELLGMVLSICLCKNIHTEDYTKVPKY